MTTALLQQTTVNAYITPKKAKKTIIKKKTKEIETKKGIVIGLY